MRRLTMELPDESRARLDIVRKLMQAASVTESVRRSARLAESIYKHLATGGTILFRDVDGTTYPVVVP